MSSSYTFNKESLLGSAKSARGMVNMMTLVTAFVLSIMVINNYNQCAEGSGYPKDRTFVKGSYWLAIMVLVVACVMFAYDIAVIAKVIR